MNTFYKLGYQYVPNILSKDICDILSSQFLLMRDNVMLEYKKVITDGSYFANDDLVKNSYSVYGSLFSDPLLEIVKPKIENIVGKKLYSSYTYSRVYYKGAVMNPHLDRPSSEYALTITISADKTPWDIFLQDFDMNHVKVSLDQGCGVLYQGTKIPHWREPYQGEQQVQFMLFWVDQDGNYADYKFDKRPILGSKPIN